MIGEFMVVLHPIWFVIVLGGNGGVYSGSTLLHSRWSYSTQENPTNQIDWVPQAMQSMHSKEYE